MVNESTLNQREELCVLDMVRTAVLVLSAWFDGF